MNYLFVSFLFTVCISIHAQCPGGCAPGPNLIINGDFSLGNTGFLSDYTYCNTSNCLFAMDDSGYSIGATPSFFHVLFSGFDHTTGTGNLFIVNGGISTLQVWLETIAVAPATNYIFSLWISSMVNFNQAQLEFYINNISIGTITAPATTNTWINFFTIWNSSTNTIATIKIIDQNNSWNGNDFALDDISFQQCNFGSPPQVSVSGNITTICPGQSSTLTASGTSTYSWSTGSTSNPIVVSPTVSTSYTVIGLDSCGSDTAIITITVNSIPTANAGADVTICPGTTVTLTATGGTSYLWNTGDTDVSITVSPTNTTSYTVTVSNSCGSDSDVVTVAVSSFITVNITGNTIICEGQSTMLTASGGINYSWSTTATTSSIVVNPNTNTSYSVIATAGICADTTAVIVTVNPSPLVNVYSDTTITQGQNITLTASGGGNYSWSNGETTSAITVAPSVTTNYCVWVTDTNGCTDSSCATVTIKLIECTEKIFVPNAFSPNDDNENDVLLAQRTICVKEFLFVIFNRWGEKVFETTDVTKAWDGTHNNKKVSTQVFTYYIEVVLTDGTPVRKKGNISLFR